MEDCIFCKIVKGDIPSSKVYEDGEFFAFLDINPVSKGHVLLIPKLHVQWMQETPDELVGRIFILTKKLMKKMQENIPCDFVQLSVMGEEVPHFHIHLIPTFFDNKLARWEKTKYESPEEIQNYVEKIKE